MAYARQRRYAPKRKIKTIITLACFFFIWFPMQTAEACEPYPEYWYTESITFTASSLPEQVSIYTTNPDTTPRAAFWLYNKNEAPIFIMPKKDNDQMIVSADLLTSADEIAMVTVNVQNSPVTLEMDKLMELDSSLQDPNPVNMSRPSPDGLQIPEPQHSELILVYHNQVITIPFSVTYSINPHNSVEDCQRWWQESGQTEAALAQLITTAEAKQAQSPDQAHIPTEIIIALIVPGVIIMIILLAKRLVVCYQRNK